jgi:hypothetical protein
MVLSPSCRDILQVAPLYCASSAGNPQASRMPSGEERCLTAVTI